MNHQGILKGLFSTGVWILFSAAAAVASTGRPTPVKSPPVLSVAPTPACPSGSVGEDRGGGESPDPLTLFNQHLELADGELYLLDGRIYVTGGYPYLWVDLRSHPWLANRQRRDLALYPLNGSVQGWRSLEGAQVRLGVRAKWAVVPAGQYTARLEISLDSIPELSQVVQLPHH